MGPLAGVSVYNRKMRWLVLSAGLLGTLFLVLPLDMLVELGTRVSPSGALQDKTVLLLRALKVALPGLGIAGMIWLYVPLRRRQDLARAVHRVTSSPWAMPAILVLALLLRVGWVLVFPTQLYAESNWYYDKGSELASGYGYVYDLESRKPTAGWPVGYPLFLAALFWLTGPSLLVAKLANVGLSVLIVYLTYLTAKRLFNQDVAVFSALLLSLLPGLFVYSSIVCSDLLFMMLVMLVAVLTLDRREEDTRFTGWKATGVALLTGLLNGALTLTRSLGLALLPFWIWVRWSVDRRGPRSLRRWVLAMVIGTGLLLAPWTIRNYVHFHKIIPVSTNGGGNFWIGNNPLANGALIFPRDEARNPLLPLIETGDEIGINEMGYRLGLAFIRENPIRALKLLPAKVFYLFNSNDQGLVWNRSSALSPVQWGTGVRAFMLTNLAYVLVAALALVGLLALFFRRHAFQATVWMGVALGACLTLVHLPFFGSDRFALPLLPFMTIYAAFALWSILAIDQPVV